MSKLQSLKYKEGDSKLNKKNKKIILNTAEDLLNIPDDDFNKINISNLSGKYYDQIYKEALLFEEKKSKIKNKKKLKENKIETKNAKQKLNKSKLINIKNINPLKGILKTNQRRKREIKIGKSRSNSKERKLIIKKPNYKIIANNFNVNIINNINADNKHLFSPEIPSKINPFPFKEIKPKKINANKNKINNKKFELDSEEIKNNKNIEVNLLNAFNKIKINEAKNNTYIAKKERNNTNENNNQILNFNRKYKSDELKNNKKIIESEYKINRIIFCIRYDSNYGDNIGILGSIEELGNWAQDKILYLKWNNGNIWKGEINIENLNVNIFEFKFINRYDGIIYWEKGFNNVVDLKGIIEELRYQKKGRYNKYEYNYDINNFDLILSCRIKGWE